MNEEQVFRVVVSEEQAGERIDRLLVSLLTDTTRASVQRWIADSRVLVDGAECRPKDKVRRGASIEVRPDLPPATDAEPDSSVVFDVLFEDQELLVVNKPAGLVVHPGRGHSTGTLVNGLLARAGFERSVADPQDPQGQLRPGIVHRIDKDTSGILVVAKTAHAREHLKAQLADHSMDRQYQALTVGRPAARKIATLHGRDPRSRLRFSSRVSSGKEAVTYVKVLESYGAQRAALVACELETGRTHQIRVHLSIEANTPILADELYGGLRGAPEVIEIAKQLGRQALHAKVLGFIHPRSGERMRFETELPDDMKAAMAALSQLTADS